MEFTTDRKRLIENIYHGAKQVKTLSGVNNQRKKELAGEIH
jgi:hypothetical protein